MFGAIPVVFDDLPLPFEGEVINWEPCVVRVNSSEISSSVTFLRSIPKAQIGEMRAACKSIFSRHMKTADAIFTTMFTVLKKRFRFHYSI